MSYNLFACGAFGILLSDYAKELKDLYTEFLEEVEEHRDDPEARDDVARRYSPRFIEAFRALGIHVPEGAELHYTDEEEDRPGSTETPGNDWVLGFGLFTNPWDWPPMDESFREVARFEQWVVGG